MCYDFPNNTMAGSETKKKKKKIFNNKQLFKIRIVGAKN